MEAPIKVTKANQEKEKLVLTNPEISHASPKDHSL